MAVGYISDVSYCQTSSAFVEAIAMHRLIMNELEIILIKAENKHGSLICQLRLDLQHKIQEYDDQIIHFPLTVFAGVMTTLEYLILAL